MLPEPLRQGFDISNQTPPDSSQNPATRPLQKSVHFKRNIPLPFVPGQVLAHCISIFSMDTSWYRSNVEKMCRGHPGHKKCHCPIASQALVAQDMGPSWRLQDGPGWLKYQPIKMPILGWFMALGLPHDIEYQSLGLPIGPETWSYRKWNWDEQRTWGAGTVMQLQPHIFRGLCYWYPNGLLDLNAQIPAIMVNKAMGCHGMGRSVDDLFWCGSLWISSVKNQAYGTTIDTIAYYRILSHTIAYYRILSHTIAYYRILSHTIASFSSMVSWPPDLKGRLPNDSTDLQSKLPQMALIFTLSGQVISLHEPGIISA